MATTNQVGFRLDEPYLSLFEEEAGRKKISIHQLAKQYTIAGFEASVSSDQDNTILKNVVFTVCLIQEQLVRENPDLSDVIVTSAQQKATAILERMKEGEM